MSSRTARLIPQPTNGISSFRVSHAQRALGAVMSSVRVPGSLRRIAVTRRSEVKPSAAPKKESRAATLFTAALLTAGSPVTVAIAQGTLPPLNVEATQPKRKAKTPSPTQSIKSAPVVAPAPTAPQAPGPSVAKDANPYANPNAPYNVERSASGKLTERLVNTPRTITAVPREVMEDTAVTSIRDLARQTPGVTLGFGEGGNAFRRRQRAGQLPTGLQRLPGR